MRLKAVPLFAAVVVVIGLADAPQPAFAQDEAGAPMNIVPGVAPVAPAARPRAETPRPRTRAQTAQKPEPVARANDEAARATPGSKPAPAQVTAAAPAPVPVPVPMPVPTPVAAPTREQAEDAALARDYCSAIGAHASDALLAWQVRRIAELESKLDERIAELERKRAEYQTWYERQQETQKRMDDGVVAIVAKMRPDAAASQLSVMDETVAAALLARLEPRSASVILNEMAAAKAARLADNMTGRATPARPRQ